MVAWWKRLLFSLASIVAAAIVCMAAIVVESADKSHPVSFRSSEVILTLAVIVGFCLIGWVFAVPAVLLVTNIRGGRFWLYWVLGSCVGPLLMLALCAVVFLVFPQGSGSPWLNPALRPLVYLAGAISSLTSLFYLLLLRRAQIRAAAATIQA
ncbi:MAG TPA: hypothetical protein VGG56_15430 [Terracidiphilus sp.]|jgi:hypothetical protein